MKAEPNIQITPDLSTSVGPKRPTEQATESGADLASVVFNTTVERATQSTHQELAHAEISAGRERVASSLHTTPRQEVSITIIHRIVRFLAALLKALERRLLGRLNRPQPKIAKPLQQKTTPDQTLASPKAKRRIHPGKIGATPQR